MSITQALKNEKMGNILYLAAVLLVILWAVVILLSMPIQLFMCYW
jgi:hypothetical protein